MTNNLVIKTWVTTIRSLLLLMAAMLTPNTAMAMSQDVTMQVGETKTLNLPSSFTNMYPYCKTTTWMSYGNEYVTVTSSSQFSATIKAKKAFSAPIVVRCDYYYYMLSGGKYVYGGHTYYDFLVTVEGTQPTAISLSPSEATLDRGQSVNLQPVLTPSNASTAFSWSTSNAGVATVDNTGHVIGQNYGEATITCKTANGLTAKCYVTVQRPAPTSVSIDDMMTLTVGETKTLTPTIKPSNTSTTYNWKSDNPQVATVNSSGKVTAIKKGYARITVTTANGLSDYCDVTVKAPSPTSVAINSTMTLEVGQSETLIPSLSPSNAETTYSWTSSNSNVATVSSGGTVKGIAPGTTTVICKTSNEKTAKCQVTVKEQVVEPTSISLTECLDMVVGDEYQLSVTICPSNATTDISWSSNNVNVATVSNGWVKAKGTGTCEIKATTSNGLTAVCQLTVAKGNSGNDNTEIKQEWEGNYLFNADVTRYVASEMPFDETFEMTITKKEDAYYITSMMGCNPVFIIYEGLKVNIIDDRHAEIILRYNNNLGDPINGGHYENFHELNTDGEYTYIRDQVITITRNADGTAEMSDFYIYAFGSSTNYEFQKEARYSNISSCKMETADVIKVCGNGYLLEVYDLNGRCIYNGPKGKCPRLNKGMYIFKSGSKTRKIVVR